MEVVWVGRNMIQCMHEHVVTSSPHEDIPLEPTTTPPHMRTPCRKPHQCMFRQFRQQACLDIFAMHTKVFRGCGREGLRDYGSTFGRVWHDMGKPVCSVCLELAVLFEEKALECSKEHSSSGTRAFHRCKERSQITDARDTAPVIG